MMREFVCVAEMKHEICAEERGHAGWRDAGHGGLVQLLQDEAGLLQ